MTDDHSTASGPVTRPLAEVAPRTSLQQGTPEQQGTPDEQPRGDQPVDGAEPDPDATAVVAPVGPVEQSRPRSRRRAGRQRRIKARKVHRVIRHVSVYSVVKFAVIFLLSAYIVILVAGAVLWSLAETTGQVDDVEGFIEDLFNYETFTIDTDTVLRALVIGGLVLVAAGTVLTALLGVVFNLVSDIVGGIRITLLEETTVDPAVAAAPDPDPETEPGSG